MIGLGLDAGGSAMRWALARDGDVIARGEVPAVSGHLFNSTEQARLRSAAAELAQAVGTTPSRVIAGITGLSAGTPEATMAATILGAALGIDPDGVDVNDDMWIAYRAVFEPGQGHLIYAGTGSIGTHMRADGSMLRVGGRGALIDDGGSAYWIAREALRRLWQAIDDDPAAARNPLAVSLAERIGSAEWVQMRAYVYGGGRAEMAALALSVAAANDGLARQIMHDAGAELARLGQALVRREGLRPVALIGRAASLHPAILDGLRAAAPELSVTLASPDIVGAAALLAALPETGQISLS